MDYYSLCRQYFVSCNQIEGTAQTFSSLYAATSISNPSLKLQLAEAIDSEHPNDYIAGVVHAISIMKMNKLDNAGERWVDLKDLVLYLCRTPTVFPSTTDTTQVSGDLGDTTAPSKVVFTESQQLALREAFNHLMTILPDVPSNVKLEIALSVSDLIISILTSKTFPSDTQECTIVALRTSCGLLLNLPPTKILVKVAQYVKSMDNTERAIRGGE
jgi:hypothetical protein